MLICWKLLTVETKYKYHLQLAVADNCHQLSIIHSMRCKAGDMQERGGWHKQVEMIIRKRVSRLIQQYVANLGLSFWWLKNFFLQNHKRETNNLFHVLGEKFRRIEYQQNNLLMEWKCIINIFPNSNWRQSLLRESHGCLYLVCLL